MRRYPLDKCELDILRRGGELTKLFPAPPDAPPELGELLGFDLVRYLPDGTQWPALEGPESVVGVVQAGRKLPDTWCGMQLYELVFHRYGAPR